MVNPFGQAGHLFAVQTAALSYCWNHSCWPELRLDKANASLAQQPKKQLSLNWYEKYVLYNSSEL